MTGDRIVDRHFEIVFDNNTILMRNLELDCDESCGLYQRLFEGEGYVLRPGSAF